MRILWRDVKHPRIDLRSGEIVVIAAPGTDVQTLIEKRREWIDKKLQIIVNLKNQAEREIEKHGVRVLDKFVKVERNCTKVGLYGDKLYFCEKRRRFLREQLKALLREDLGRRIDQYSEILGVRPNRVYIREQRTKWGSCSSSRNLSFNFSLVFLPEGFRKYVVVHEMVHLIHRGHGTAFHSELKKLKVRVPGRDEILYNWYYAEACKKKLML